MVVANAQYLLINKTLFITINYQSNMEEYGICHLLVTEFVIQLHHIETNAIWFVFIFFFFLLLPERWIRTIVCRLQ